MTREGEESDWIIYNVELFRFLYRLSINSRVGFLTGDSF